MNNIYKVIWSKAKNCYVVASEIARSHTKSATGSEKIGGVTRRSLLASLMALSLLCGGLGVASAANGTVHVEESAATTGTAVVYTQEGTESYVEQALTNYDTKDKVNEKIEALRTGDVATNRADIITLNGKTAGLSADGKSLTDMNSVETGALKVTGNISDGTVTTTLTDINDSMTQTKTNKADIVNLKTTTGKQDTAIKDLQKKTTNISYADGAGTSIDGITVKDGNIVGNGNSAITGLTNVATGSIKTDSINGKSLTGTNVATEKEVKDVADAVKKETDARTEADKALDEKITKNSQNIATLNENGVKYDTDVKDKITLKGVDGTTITHLKDAALNDSSTEAVTGKQLYKTNAELAAETKARTDKDTELEKGIAKNSGDITALDGKIKTNADNIQANSNAIAATNKRTAGIDRIDARHETTIEGHVTVDDHGNVTADGKLTGDGVDAGAGGITTKGSLNVENASHLKGDVTMDNKLSVTGDTSLKKTDVNGALTVTGESSLKNTTVGGTLGVTGATTLKGTLTAEKDATFEKNVTVEKDLTVNGKLNVDKISMKNDELKNGKKHDSATTITADEISNLAKVTEQGNTTESQFTHNEKGTFNYAKAGNTTDWKESTSNVTANGVANTMTDSDGNTHTYYQTATETREQLVNGDKSKSNFEKKTAEGNTISITEKDADGNLKSSLTNTQTVNGEKTSVTNKDSSSTIKQGADQIRYNVTSKDENKTSSSIEVKADGITNTSKDGTITNDAKDIVNNTTGDMTNNVGGKLTTIVNGAAEETYKSGLKTDITGDETHTVTGKQTNTVKGGQENNISGGQKNNILTGNQETTVSDGSIINKAEHGDISNTAKNVTNEGTESVTNKVGTNEVKVSKDGVDIKVDADKTIKESVGADTSRTMTDGRIIDKAGDMTVTTDKTTGTTFGNGTPNDTTVINGGTIGTNKVNANETNTKKLTAGAAADADGGRLTVDAKDGVKGSYKSGKYTSRSYILANTLKSGVDNGKEPTDAGFMGSRTDHYMDRDKAKLDETVKDADGSNVTNKTSTGTVTTITDGITTSIIDQKKDSITSAVGDGTTSTVIKQDKDNVTIASSAGTVGIAGKDIINKATDTITNTAGTKITDTAGDSTVTTENGKGTTFTKTGSTAYREGGPTDTNISGNTITTGKVTMDYADVMKDLGVRGKTTTGSLEVTGTSTLTGDVTMGSNATVKGNFNVEGNTNLKNTKVDGTLDVTQKATFGDSVSIAKDLSVGGDVTAKSYKVGDKTYISADGINANDQKITNVADGSISEGSKDAVNGGQLYGMKTDLEHKVDKVGANAAAMANLHPMEFDPDSKWNIAAAMGNYGSETATAIGAFYRPNEDVMVNFSTAFGTGENMVGGGVSVRLGKGGNKLSREESNALKAQVNDLTARMDALLSVLNPNMSKDFPDVPENHWAYEAVSRLAGNDIVQGYPDGEFHGERTMTRYEMAEIIYNALSRGAEAEKELVEEFKPELQAMAASEKATAERAEG